MRSIHRSSIALLLLIPIGCDNSPPAPVTSAAPSGNAIAEAAPTEQPAVQADIKSWQEVQAWVAEQRGKIVVVDVWSTSCVPCRKEFPHLVELHEEFTGDVACVSVNIDYYGGEAETLENIKSEVLTFLESHQATMQNFISSDPDEEVTNQISTAAIPAVLVYDRTGKLHTTFNNDDRLYGPEGFSYAADIKPLVQQLLDNRDKD